MYTCNCGREFKTQRSLNCHGRFCDKYEKKALSSSIYKINENLYRCECGKEYNNHQSLNAHFSQCLKHRNGKPIINKWKLGKNGGCSWSKGLTKNTDDRVARNAKSRSDNYRSGKTIPSFTGKHLSPRVKEILSLKQSGENYSGGRCKWFKYVKPDNSVHTLQGTWELKFAKYLDNIDKDWIKPCAGKTGHTYIWYDKNGSKRRYTPDFWCPNLKKYFEIKGYWREHDYEKTISAIEQNNIVVDIIEYKQMKELNLL